MKKAIGYLLWLAGHIVNVLVLWAAIVYLFGAVVWMHAPLPGALRVTAAMALLPLALAWLCRTAGKYLRGNLAAAAPSPAQRWLLAGVGIVFVVACGALVRTGLSEYQCSADRSRTWATHEADTRRNGFERVCAGGLARYDISFRSLATATRKLAFTPVDLTHTPFARFESLGGRAEFVGDVPSRLYRGFRMPDGHQVTLFEQDMSADGSRSWRAPRDEPERINGLPARLVVLEDNTGTAVSLLSWVDGRRDYQLWIDANVARVPLRGQLFALAASLPHAVPACPSEPPPRPMRLDANGFPVDEPMPGTLTRAQMDALADDSKRPCK
jgi:hypothetical protein